MKLSRTGWNNVIIFSVMAFILIINITNNKIFSDDQEPTSSEQPYILGEYATILTLSIHPNVLIERIGRTWRSTPAIIQGQALDQMMRSWQHSTGNIIQEPPEVDQQMALVVNIELAGQEKTSVLNLYTTDTELLVYNHLNKQWLSFPLAIFSQLIPNEILAA